MGFLDFILGRKEQSPEYPSRRESAQRAPQRSEDEIAVERYQYLLRTAPPETIEQVHTEAFSKLTDEQRDLLFRQLTESLEPSERPIDAQPASLAQAATRAELREPGTLTRSFGNDQGGQGGQGAQGGQRGMGMAGMIGGSMLGTIAGFVIGSALVSAFLPMDAGQTDAAGEGDAGNESGADSGSDAGSDGGGGDGGGGDFGGGGGDFGGGGGDFGGGDFGGGFDF